MLVKDAFAPQMQRERRLAIEAVDRRIGLPMKYVLIPFTLLGVWVLEPEELSQLAFYLGFGLFIGGTILLTYLYRSSIKAAFLLALFCVWVEEFYVGLLATSTGASTVAPLVVLSAAPILKAGLVSVTAKEYWIITWSASVAFLGSIAALEPVHFNHPPFWWAFLSSWIIIVTGQVILDNLIKQREERLAINKQRIFLLRRMIDAQEEERKRIARELHDMTSQAVAALMVNLETAEALLSSAPARIEEARMKLEETRELASETMDVVRKIAFDLRPILLDDLGLVPAIRSYAKTHLEQAGIMVRFEAKGFDRRRLRPDLEVVIFRVAQEALTNVIKHAQAKVVDIWLIWGGNLVTAVLQDDGRGFDVAQTLGAGDKEHCLGLTGMEERVALAGGTFTIDSQQGEGTRVVAKLPVEGEV